MNFGSCLPREPYNLGRNRGDFLPAFMLLNLLYAEYA